jgi:hypothetical protein
MVEMTGLHVTLGFLLDFATYSPLYWLPTTFVAIVLVEWHAALPFLGLRCSTSLACRARASRAVVTMTCGKMLLAPGTPPSAMGLLAELGGK